MRFPRAFQGPTAKREGCRNGLARMTLTRDTKTQRLCICATFLVLMAVAKSLEQLEDQCKLM